MFGYLFIPRIQNQVRDDEEFLMKSEASIVPILAASSNVLARLGISGRMSGSRELLLCDEIPEVCQQTLEDDEESLGHRIFAALLAMTILQFFFCKGFKKFVWLLGN